LNPKRGASLQTSQGGKKPRNCGANLFALFWVAQGPDPSLVPRFTAGVAVDWGKPGDMVLTMRKRIQKQEIKTIP